ncbi:MAG: S-layer homology domain-containing protein [Clostridia bacterium]|nr:S-layer homology domain-containing protein [Clostridia bacterium]
MKKKFISVLLIMILLLPNMNVIPSSAATKLSVGETTNGYIDISGAWALSKDIDNYEFTPDTTQFYKFYLENKSVRVKKPSEGGMGSLLNSSVRLRMDIYDGDDKFLGSVNVSDGYTGTISVKLEAKKTYRMEVYVSSILGLFSVFAKGNYSITVKKQNDMGSDSWHSAEETKESAYMSAAIESGDDEDWFKFETDDAPKFLYVSLESIQGSSLDFCLYEYVKGAGEFPMRDIGEFSVYRNSKKSGVYTLNKNSTYYYAIKAYKETGYVFDFALQDDIGGSSREEAAEIDFDEKYTWSFDGYKDSDYIKFETGEKLAYYQINLEGKDIDHSAVWLYDENGKEIGNKDTGYNFSLSTSYQLEPESVYFVRFYGTEIGEYEFSVTEKIDKYPDNMEDAAKVSLNKKYETSFEASGDNDYIKFKTGSDLAYYEIYMKRSEDYEIRATLYDEDGKEVDSAERWSYSSDTISFSCQLEGRSTYYVAFYGKSSGDYEFEIRENKDEYPDIMEEAEVIELNNKYETSFEAPGDNDYIKFKTGSDLAYYEIYMKRSEDYEIRATLYDEDGNEVDSVKRWSYSSDTISFSRQLEDRSTYYIAFYGGDSGKYEFSINIMKDEDPNDFDKPTVAALNEKYQRDLCVDSDTDCFGIHLLESTPLQVKLFNESCSKLYFEVKSERDITVLSGGGYGKNNVYIKSATLEKGYYFISVYGQAGYYTLTLSGCGDGHGLEVLVPGKAATCTEKGLTDGKKCMNCETITLEQKSIKALGHNYENGKCNICGGSELCKNGHTAVTIAEKQPTCMNEGNTEGMQCSKCNVYLTSIQIIPRLSHSYVDGICKLCGNVDPALNPPVFSDVANDSWYKNAVDFVSVKGLYVWISGDRFEPDAPMKRSMLVTAMWRYAGSPEPKSMNMFADVPDGQWYTKAILWAAENGIVNGIGYGKFDPEGNITRESLAAVLNRYAKVINADSEGVADLNTFPDGGIVSEWAKVPLQWAISKGLITGTSRIGYNGSFIDPQGTATRAQVATILMRFINSLES